MPYPALKQRTCPAALTELFAPTLTDQEPRRVVETGERYWAYVDFVEVVEAPGAAAEESVAACFEALLVVES